MAGKFFAHVRAQWMGALSLFLVVAGGTAYAANTVFSSDIVDNEVFSADVRNDTLASGGLGAVDLAGGSVGTSEVADNALTGRDISEATLGIVPNANTLDGLDSARFKNTSNQGLGSCNTIVNATVCASATLSGLRTGATGDDVYLIATWKWFGNGTGADGAICRIAQNANDSGYEAIQFGQKGNEHDVSPLAAIGTMVAIDTAPPTSSMTYRMVCDETDGSVHVPVAKIVAIRLSG